MDNTCKRCTAHIDTMKGLYTICEGRCARRFHASCVGVNESDLCALSNNIIWICDECMLEFRKARDTVPDSPRAHLSSTSSVAAELDELRSQVAKINDAISKIVDQISPSDPTVPTHRHSTPVSTPSPSSNAFTCTIKQRHDDKRTIKQSHDESFSFVLSNIDCSATETDIVRLVSHSLCVPEPECMRISKLVPNWKNCYDMDYISFKIVIDKRWKRTALNAKTWPRNVKFREFVNRLDNTWKPMNT